LVFALNMLMNSTEGQTFTLPELHEMLTSAGFSSVRTVDAHTHSPLVLGQK